MLSAVYAIALLAGCTPKPFSGMVSPLAARSVEHYARETERLHPEAAAFLAPYFPGFDLRTVRVVVFDQTGWSDFRDKIATSIRLPTPTIFVRAQTVYVRADLFNIPLDRYEYTRADGTIGLWSNQAIDLATPSGQALLAHEIMHVRQWRRSPLLMGWQAMTGVLASIIYEQRFYAHSQIAYELEAIALQKRVRADVNDNRRAELERFAELR